MSFCSEEWMCIRSNKQDYVGGLVFQKQFCLSAELKINQISGVLSGIFFFLVDLKLHYEEVDSLATKVGVSWKFLCVKSFFDVWKFSLMESILKFNDIWLKGILNT